MGILNKGAGILAPLILGAMILKATDHDLFQQLPAMSAGDKKMVLDAMIRRVIVPYAGMGAILVGIGLMVRYSPLPEIDTERESADVTASTSGKANILQFPHLVLGAVAIFLHVGTQVIAIDTIIGYATSMNISLHEAKVFPAYTLAATMVGYVLGIIAIPKFMDQKNALRFCTTLGGILTLLIIFTRGEVYLFGLKADVSIYFVVMLGLANSLVYACIWPLALDALGRFTKVGASILIMGLCGSAVMPLLYGHYADIHGLREAYWILFPCYLYLMHYAFHGHKIRSWQMTKF